MASISNTSSPGWLIPVSWTTESYSAAMGNWPMFWAIHIIALMIILLSMTACVAVLAHILSHNRGGHPRPGDRVASPRSGKRSFPTRLTMYIAVVDCVWGVSHFLDHVWLIHTKTFPDRSVTLFLSTTLWLFFGYQQMVHAVLSAYTYAKVCHNYQVKFGRWDWKFHAICASPIIVLVPIFYFIQAFGPTGYWMLGDAKTLGGRLLILAAALVSGVNAFATMGGYLAISKKLASHGMSVELNTFNFGQILAQAVSFGGAGAGSGRQSTSRQSSQVDSCGGLGSGVASPTSKSRMDTQTTSISALGAKSVVSEKSAAFAVVDAHKPVITRAQLAAHCLGNIMRSAGYLYIPMSLSLLSVAISLFCEVIEPFSVLVAVIVCNCSGLVNGIAFFTNEHIKRHVLNGKEGQDGDDD